MKSVRVQSTFLNRLRKARVPVEIFLETGSRMKGTITSFDEYIIKFRPMGKRNEILIFKSSIVSIVSGVKVL